MNADEIEKLYKNRFESDLLTRNRSKIWRVLCDHFFQRFIPEDAVIADIGAGYCDFINNIRGSRKFAIDMNPDVSQHAEPDVTAIVADIDQAAVQLGSTRIDVCFMSNFLEHISKDQINGLFNSLHGILSSNGKVIIMTPNIRYVGGKYWDFYDHITPLTEKSLIEVLEQHGYRIDKCIPRFLPFTTKSRLPQKPWLVRLYLLLMPVSGRIFGEQSIIVASIKS